MTDERHLPADLDQHPEHDPLRIAALAADDLAGAEQAAAESVVRTCPACATLHADLIALSRATRVLPPPTRTRDFRLDASRAERLSPWRRVAARLAGSTAGLRRPLATSLAALGVVGLLLSASGSSTSTILSTIGSSVGGAYRMEAQGSPATDDRAASGQEGTASGAPAASAAAAPPQVQGQGQASGDRDTQATPGTVPGPKGVASAPAGAVPWLPLVSLGLLGVGALLFALPRRTPSG